MNGSTAEHQAACASLQPVEQVNRKPRKPSFAQNIWPACVAALGGVVNLAVVAWGAGGRAGAIVSVCVTCLATLAAIIAAKRRATAHDSVSAQSEGAAATELSPPVEAGSGQGTAALALRETIASAPAIEAGTVAGPPNGTRAEFLLRFSHELRTSLNALVAVTDLLAETQLDDTQRNYLEVSRTSSQHLMEMVSEAADLSAIESGRLALESEDFDLQSLVSEVARAVAPLAGQKNIVLTATVDKHAIRRLHGDPRRIHQALVNLLRNAVKFTERGAASVLMNASTEDNDSAGGRPMLRFDVTDTRPARLSSRRHCG